MRLSAAVAEPSRYASSTCSRPAEQTLAGCMHSHARTHARTAAPPRRRATAGSMATPVRLHGRVRARGVVAVRMVRRASFSAGALVLPWVHACMHGGGKHPDAADWLGMCAGGCKPCKGAAGACRHLHVGSEGARALRSLQRRRHRLRREPRLALLLLLVIIGAAYDVAGAGAKQVLRLLRKAASAGVARCKGDGITSASSRLPLSHVAEAAR